MDNYRLTLILILSFCYLIATLVPGIAAGNENNIKGNEQDYYPVPRSLSTFGKGDPIYGIYRYKDNVYLIRDSQPYVEEYSAYGLNEPKGHLNVSGNMTGHYDMVGDDDSRSLFIMNWNNWFNVTTVSTKSQNQVANFSIREPNATVVALAATKEPSDSDVVLTCALSFKIKEFTMSGKLVRQVNIPSEMVQPRHAIKLQSGDGYALCHGYYDTDDHRVCLLNNAGEKLNCFGSVRGSGEKNLDLCARIAEDDDGNILVADRNNKRVIVLSHKNKQLKFKQEIVRERDGLDGPMRILIDRHILYVVDNEINSEGWSVRGKVRVFRVKDGEKNY